jgi:hypothetical protein
LHSLKGVGGGGFDLGERIFGIGKCFLEEWGKGFGRQGGDNEIILGVWIRCWV